MTEDSNALPRGFSLHRYQIDGVLGAGGFGITYRALHEALENQVAIKEYFPAEWAYRDHDCITVRANAQGQIPARAGEPPCYEWGLQRFLDEAKILVQINHPCVVRVRDYFTANGSAYIVMEYEDGESLSTLLQRGGILPEHELRHLLDDVMPALEAVHGQGYLHRDLKPSNLYIRTVDGRVMLIDFGAARQALGRRTRSVTSVVTPGYSPIEQYVTVGDDYGPWTDLYALGAVLYRCITGAPPVEAPGRVLKDPVQPAVECGAGLYSRPLLRLIDQALAVRPEERFQSVAAMREALRIADQQATERTDSFETTPASSQYVDLSLSHSDLDLELDSIPFPTTPSTPATPSKPLISTDPWSETRDIERRSKPFDRESGSASPLSHPSQSSKKLSDWMSSDFNTSTSALSAVPAPAAGAAGPKSDPRSVTSFPLLDNIWDEMAQSPAQPQTSTPLTDPGSTPISSPSQPQSTTTLLGRNSQSAVEHLRKGAPSRASRTLLEPAQEPTLSQPIAADARSINSPALPNQQPAPPALEPQDILFRPRREPIHWRTVILVALSISGIAGGGLLGYGYFENVQGRKRWEAAQKQQEQEEIARHAKEQQDLQEADIADKAQKIQSSIASRNLVAAELGLEQLADVYPDHPTVAALRATLLSAQKHGAGAKTWTDSKTGIKMVWINGGCFTMGSAPAERDRGTDEVSHQACLNGFWISATEITNNQYRRFKADHNSGNFQGRLLSQDQQPVVNLTWDNAKAFAEWLSWENEAKNRFRLPTEAEWEYAARSQTNTRYYWGNQIDPHYANFSDRNDPSGASISNLDDGQAVTAPVGSYQPNGYGLNDMAGNVWEWTCSEYDKGYGGQELRCSEKSTADGLRVTRGGSWNSGLGDLRSAKRLPRKPDFRDAMTGFRVVMEEKE